MGRFTGLFGYGLDKPKSRQLEDYRRTMEAPTGVPPLQACDEIPGGRGEFGRCKTNPIPVNGPIGEDAYIGRLRSPSGAGFIYHRIASVVSDTYPHPVDCYEMVSYDAKHYDALFFAMYHPRRSVRAPQGLSLTAWHDVPEYLRYGIKAGSYGTHERLRNFPLDLPDAIRRNPAICALSPGVAEQIARRLEEHLARNGDDMVLLIASLGIL